MKYLLVVSSYFGVPNTSLKNPKFHSEIAIRLFWYAVILQLREFGYGIARSLLVHVRKEIKATIQSLRIGTMSSCAYIMETWQILFVRFRST